jgi:hypothetical protein
MSVTLSSGLVLIAVRPVGKPTWNVLKEIAALNILLGQNSCG